MPRDFDVASVGVSEEDYSSFVDQSLNQTKASTLAGRKDEKLKALGGKVVPEWVDMSRADWLTPTGKNQYGTSEVGGYDEWGGNKIYNELEAGQLQGATGELYNQYGMFPVQDDQGNIQSWKTRDAEGNLVDYTGELGRSGLPKGYSNLYGFGTKADEEQFKLGTWAGSDDPAGRYFGPNPYEQGTRFEDKVGPLGVDKDKLQMNLVMPTDVVNTLERAYHGNERVLGGRVLRDETGPQDDQEFRRMQKLIGTGSSEVYTDKGALFGDSRIGTQADEQLVDSIIGLAGRGKNVPIDEKDYDKEVAAWREKNISTAGKVGEEIGQVISGGLAGVGKGAIELADVVQELGTWGPQAAVRAITGDENYDIDLINEKAKEAAIGVVDKFVGYDRALDEASLEKVKENITKSGIDITSSDSVVEALTNPDKRKHLWSGTLEVLSNPSLTATMVTEIIGAGGLLGTTTKVALKASANIAPKLTAKADKLLKTNRVDMMKGIQEVKASSLSQADKIARVAELEKNYNIAKKLPDLLKGTAYTNADMAIRVNNDMDEFAKNNDGEDPDALKTLQIVALNRIVSAMEVGALKYEAKIGQLGVDVATKGIAQAGGKAIAHIGKSGLVEAGQETVDSIVEQINQKLGSDDYKDKSLKEILSETSAEILTGTLAGGAGGVHVGTAAGAKDLVSEQVSLEGVKDKVVQASDKLKEMVPKKDEKVEDIDLTPEFDTEEYTKEQQKEAEATFDELMGMGAAKAGAPNRDVNQKLEAVASALIQVTEERPDVKQEVGDKVQTALRTLRQGGRTKEASVLSKALLRKAPEMVDYYGSDKQSLVEFFKDSITNIASVDEDYLDFANDFATELVARDIITNEEVVPLVKEAEKTGQAYRTLLKAKQVHGDVSSGGGGYVSYYENAREALARGDDESYSTNVDKLAKLKSHFDNKISKIDQAVRDTQNEVYAEVERSLLPKGLEEGSPEYNKAYDAELLAYKSRLSNTDEDKVRVVYGKSVKEKGKDLAFDINKSTVADAMQTKHKGKADFGFYGPYNQMKAEQSAMTSLADQLSGATRAEVQSTREQRVVEEAKVEEPETAIIDKTDVEAETKIEKEDIVKSEIKDVEAEAEIEKEEVAGEVKPKQEPLDIDFADIGIDPADMFDEEFEVDTGVIDAEIEQEIEQEKPTKAKKKVAKVGGKFYNTPSIADTKDLDVLSKLNKEIVGEKVQELRIAETEYSEMLDELTGKEASTVKGLLKQANETNMDEAEVLGWRQQKEYVDNSAKYYRSRAIAANNKNDAKLWSVLEFALNEKTCT